MYVAPLGISNQSHRATRRGAFGGLARYQRGGEIGEDGAQDSGIPVPPGLRSPT